MEVFDVNWTIVMDCLTDAIANAGRAMNAGNNARHSPGDPL